MQSWSVSIRKGGSDDFEILDLSRFNSKRSAQCHAESYIFDRLVAIDGLTKIEPHLHLRPNQNMEGLEVTREYISNLECDKDITSANRYFVVAENNPWRLTLHHTKIHMKPIIITEVVEEKKEVEVEEKKEIEKKIVILTPHRFWFTGREERTVLETVSGTVKREVTDTKKIERVEYERVVKGVDLFTLYVVKNNMGGIFLPPVELPPRDELIAKEFSKKLERNEAFKALYNGGLLIAELLVKYPEAFGRYVPCPAGAITILSRPIDSVFPEIPISKIPYSLASIRDQILLRRKEMFGGSDADD